MPLTDSQKIAVIFDRTERIDKALYDRPGLLDDVATLRAEMDEVKVSVPSSKEKRAGWAVIITALITAVGGAAAAALSH